MILALWIALSLSEVDLVVIGKTLKDMLEIFSVARDIQGNSNDSNKMMDLRLLELFGLLLKRWLNAIFLISDESKLSGDGEMSDRDVDGFIYFFD